MVGGGSERGKMGEGECEGGKEGGAREGGEDRKGKWGNVGGSARE